jgi:hypothetical protein
MSLSRSRAAALRSAGWTVIEDGPLVRLRVVLRSLLGRRQRQPLVHLPPGREWSR